eukprot:PhM_4_TR1137/c0_g1_i1/m.49301
MLRSRILRCATSSGKYNPWDVLGVRAGAPAHELRDKYHLLMQAHHPEMASDGVGNIQKMDEIDKAYIMITKAPTLDKRYKNLLTDTQHMYYKVLPEWMARNVDEMPRYWSWVRWRVDFAYLVLGAGLLCFILGRLVPTYPRWVSSCAAAFVIDCLLHTQLLPILLVALFFRVFGDRQAYSMAWLMSPKGFLRRELEY